MQNLTIDSARLWQSLMQMAEIGATEKGGVCRLALTDLDREGRDLFVKWVEAIDCQVRVDAAGNLFARRAGNNNSLAAVMTGSHLDSQPTGGKFDGAYGVLAGLEVLRTLHDRQIFTAAPLEVVVWTNEEGSRFAPAMVGSGAYAGVFDLEYTLSRVDSDGITLGDELERLGYAGSEPLGSALPSAYFEAHIEQGPILEAEETTIGIVSGAQGQRWYEVTVTGQEAHAGPTPMASRRDALVAAAKMVGVVNEIGLSLADACATCGMLNVHPNSRNVIPGRVWFTIDFRHPDDSVVAEMNQAMRDQCGAIAERAGVSLAIDQIWEAPAVRFDSECVDAVRSGAQMAGLSHRDIVSGAGHDAVNMSKVAPTGMIFVPCEDGISHNESENASPADLAAGCQVLMHAMLARAGIGIAAKDAL